VKRDISMERMVFLFLTNSICEIYLVISGNQLAVWLD
jgi:hypothetical protein